MQQLISFIIFISLTYSALAREVSEKRINKVLSHRAKAVLVVEILNKKGQQIDKGVGFFISPSGVFLMSRHIFEKYLENKSKTMLKVTDHYGRTIDKISFGKCGAKGSYDLCMLKAEQYKVKSFFPESRLPNYKVTSEMPHEDLQILAIGHCRKDYGLIRSRAKYYKKSSYLEMITRKYSKEDRGTVKDKDLIILLKPHCMGDSGGPIFSYDGELIGVLQEFMSDKRDGTGNYYIGLAVTEISPFIKSGASFKKIPSSHISKIKNGISKTKSKDPFEY